MKSTETQLVNAAIEYLKMHGYMAWRNNTGAMGGQHKGKRWYVKFSVPGASDIFAIQPVTGRFVAVECKVGKNQPTKAQESFLESVRSQGGAAVCVWNLDDLDDFLRRPTER